MGIEDVIDVLFGRGSWIGDLGIMGVAMTLS